MTVDKAALRELLAKATPGTLIMATSNSWRRIVTLMRSIPVCVPYTQHDGHPDLHFPNGGPDGPDATLLLEARNALPSLLDEIDALRERLEISSEAPEWDGIACRDETIRNLEREIDALRADLQARQWQPIETAPKDGRQMILLLTPSHWPQVAYSNTWWMAGFSVECKPTHWMPLPPAPLQGETA